MAKKNIPQGFTVAYIEGAWYPLEAYRLYSAEYPEGFLCLHTLCALESDEASFSTQREALEECQEQAQMNENLERQRWAYFTRKSDVYPERCTHYKDIIEQVTGRTPIITYYDDVSVFVVGDYCPHCKTVTRSVASFALTIEDALEAAAQQVYAQWCTCLRDQAAYQELLTA